ncbi:hypothetical protein EG328_008715 [Venturia inaequalis]|uniref:Uncharacterized protein n=1 Tax=Venturia inaequalis TaxID=5025 RepID=A0A8H3VKP8_VENIN|nr:hypothetical protein EG328_008715 [Venturia inaequalis]
MATPIDPPTIPPSPAVPTLSNKRKRSFSNVDNGIATPPKSPKVLSSFSGQYLKREENSLLPSPPNSIQASPEPPTLESSATLVTFIQDLKDGKTLSKFETSFSIEAEELERFEEAVGRNKVLSGYYRKRLRYEWDPTSCVFTILKASAETEGICYRISQCLEKQLRELADAGFTLKGLDSWERKRVKELADLIRPLPLRRLDIGGFRMSPDLCFTFGTTESLLGMAHRLVEPLVVFETTFLTLPAELRQKTLSYTHTDKDLTDNLRMVVDLDSKWALKTVYMPDVQPGLATIWAGKLSTVHFVIAQDMEWVEEAWKKRGGALAETQTRLDAKRDDWDADYTSSPRWREIFKARKV